LEIFGEIDVQRDQQVLSPPYGFLVLTQGNYVPDHLIPL